MDLCHDIGFHFGLMMSLISVSFSIAFGASFDRFRQGAISLLTDAKVQAALDVRRISDATQDRYGRNSFGYSLLMARRLIDCGVRLIQVNLGNDETWDTHGNAFPHLKDHLFPPTDRAVSALLDDLAASGQLDETLIVMAGEFGRVLASEDDEVVTRRLRVAKQRGLAARVG